MAYGVQPTGYVRKPLSVILAEIEASMENHFGEGVIQTPQTPFGNWNGMAADLASDMEELNLELYQSFDPDQSEGTRLEALAAIRGLERGDDRSDAELAAVITNRNSQRIRMNDRLQKIRAVPGVTWASVRENSGRFPDDAGVPRNSLAFAVLGGSDQAVALAIYNNTVPGIGLYGMTSVATSVDGYCRQINFTRPEDVPIYVDMNLKVVRSACSCSLVSPDDVETYVDNYLNGDCGLMNGDLVDFDRLASVIGQLGGLSLTSALLGTSEDNLTDAGVQTSIFQRPVVVTKNINVRFT